MDETQVAIRGAFDKFVAEVRHVQSEIALVAPPLGGETETLISAGKVYNRLESHAIDEASLGYVSPWNDLVTYRDSIRTCRTSLSDHLYGERAAGVEFRMVTEDGDSV